MDYTNWPHATNFQDLETSCKCNLEPVTKARRKIKNIRSNFFNYSRSSRKRPPREFRKVVATWAGRLQEWALVSDHVLKQ